MKMYYFSFAKNAHNIEFRRNRLFSTIRDMENGEIPYNPQSLEDMESEYQQLTEVLSYWDGRPSAKIPGYLYGVAQKAVLWATSTRYEINVAQGHHRNLEYC